MPGVLIPAHTKHRSVEASSSVEFYAVF